MDKLIRKCQNASGGPLTIYNTGDKYPESNQCAYFTNHILNDAGYMLSGDAWTPRGYDMIFNGFLGTKAPIFYSESKYDKYAKEAVANVRDNFSSKDSLDLSKAYAVNMYYKDSPNKKVAYRKGKDNIYGTHTGYLQYDPKDKTWYVTHNIHGTIYKDPFFSIQNPEGNYGVTAIYEPRVNTFGNRVRTKLGLKLGGKLD